MGAAAPASAALGPFPSERMALPTVELKPFTMLRKASSLAAETALTFGCSCPTALTSSFSAALVSTDPTQ